MEWSDGFAPLSGAKSNRGSYWIKSVTILPQPCSLHEMSHTCPIALGYVVDSHETVEKLFASKLYEFCAKKTFHFIVVKNIAIW
jgi:hypothetical protein